MDWFSWLSKTGLDDPSIVYSYAITFTRNQLEEDDIAYFNHEILQSMGISIAKHRLEILKLARKKKKHHHHKSMRPVMFWLILAAKQAKNYVAKHVNTLVRGQDHSALAIAPKRNRSSRWKAAAMLSKRNNRWLAAAKQEGETSAAAIAPGPKKILMLTNGSPLVESCVSWSNSFSSAAMGQDFGNNEKIDRGLDEVYWSSSGVGDIRWDAMFQDLKPT